MNEARIHLSLARRGIVAALALLGIVAVAHGQGSPTAYPARPIRLVVPSSPGGGTDIVGRVLAQKLGELLAQPLVVDNRPGAGTVIGTELAAKSAPDGYTLLMGLSTLAIDPSIHAKLPYDALRDFAPVSLVASVPNVLTMHPAVSAASVAELIALARAQPGRLSYGSAGLGTNPHLAAELFGAMTGIAWVHVPYKGSGPAVIALLAGQVDLMFATLPSAVQHIKAGKLRALGVSTVPDARWVVVSTVSRATGTRQSQAAQSPKKRRSRSPGSPGPPERTSTATMAPIASAPSTRSWVPAPSTVRVRKNAASSSTT